MASRVLMLCKHLMRYCLCTNGEVSRHFRQHKRQRKQRKLRSTPRAVLPPGHGTRSFERHGRRHFG